MDHHQQEKFNKAEILDLSSEITEFDSTSWLLSSALESQNVKTTENYTRECHKKKKILGCPIISAEELKIRSELEMEIEKHLEDEINESIYCLALRLRRIYKQRKERNNAKYASEYGNNHQLLLNDNNIIRISNNGTFSGVNIWIRMEGGRRTKVEIKDVAKRVCPKTVVKEVNGFGAKNQKFDWVNTLREGSSSPVVAAVDRSNGGSKSKHKSFDLKNVFSNSKLECGKGKNNGGSPCQGKKSASVDQEKILQLEWKF
ncbi:uncharacterized protein [Arachis hypogaea]|uniref:Uncharacterized protein n=1 Tax=Arachis hypogaea TaxID=3818 RepID=A0A444WW85_ARAHY|nr:uncharacterized protein LOC112746836 [Arachis hypogaea]XP_025703287.1 uncharacterized protein LOC112804070 [Arachis hypogaea]QHO44351.1 uncharacterized protein DS421_5g170440 [Arachis hypogaea]RYQ81645.1 hypothetical protein Ahy_Scaffold1g107515 [Arachis hypogaea]